MTSWLLPLMMGCAGEPDPWDGPLRDRPPGFVDPGLGVPGAGPTFALHRLEGRFTLPDSTLPAGFTPTSRFPIVMGSKHTKERKSNLVYRGESPFHDSVRHRTGPPTGMRLFVGDTEVDYHPSLRGRSWMLTEDDGLLVAWPGELPDQGVTVAWEAARDEFLRRDFGSAGLAPSEFVDLTVTHDRRTRAGLLLPAPATAEWTLTLPGGPAFFDAWLTMAPMAIDSLRSDGAGVVLQVDAGGETHTVSTKAVAGRAGWEHWRANLSGHGPGPVTVRLITEPGGTHDFDHVFVGAPTVYGAPTGDVRRVVVIGLDTTRPSHFGFYGYSRDTTPGLDAVARTSSVFVNAWTPAPRTRPSFRAATTGRRPLDAVGATNIGEVFQRNGFATAGIVANVHLQPRFDFNQGFDDWWFDGQAKADEQVDRALEFLKRNADRDTYLFLHLMDPHLFYDAPSRYATRYVTDADPELPNVFSRWEVYAMQKQGSLDDRRKAEIVARYDGEMRFMNDQLTRLFDKLDRMPGRSLVVVHNDHGEEFWEHGNFEHNHTLYEEVTRGLLWFRSGPGQQEGARHQTTATLADIAPTLYDLADFDSPPPTDGRSLAPALLGTAPLPDRPIGVAHLRYGTERWGVVHAGHKYVLHTGSGVEELYDLAADSSESTDLSKRTPLQPYRKALAAAHDMPVGRGWRVRPRLRPATPSLSIVLPQPALHVAIIDPESTRATPVNQAWGETPPRTATDIGSLTLDEARTTLTFTAGSKPWDAVLMVLFDADVPPSEASLIVDGEAVELPQTPGELVWRRGPDSLTFEPGTVLVPPPGEAQRMQALSDAGSDRAELCALGYIECDDE